MSKKHELSRSLAWNTMILGIVFIVIGEYHPNEAGGSLLKVLGLIEIAFGGISLYRLEKN